MKKTSITLINILLLIPLLAGCFSKNQNEDKTENPEMPEVIEEETFKISNPDYDCAKRKSKDEFTYKDLFNLSNKVSISINVDIEELRKIYNDNNYGSGNKPEIYHLAKNVKIVITNYQKTYEWNYENVGIRQKGNTSRKPIFSDGDLTQFNAHNHFKLSFDETFTNTDFYSDDFIDEYGNANYEDREFLGLSGLDIKWDKNDDTTHLKEIYSNMMLRSSGIISQHVGLSMVDMNISGDEIDFGLCYIYEPSSKSLIKRALSSGDHYINCGDWKKEKVGEFGVPDRKYGDLYKGSYGRGNGASSGVDLTSDSINNKRVGVKTDYLGYDIPSYERKTNRNDEYDDALLKEVVNLLNSSSASFDEINEKVDLEYFAMEEAVMYFLGNPDSFRYNYNNVELYFRRTDGKMIIIPIDNDRNFGTGKDWTYGLDFAISSDTTPYSYKCTYSDQRNPLFIKTILKNNSNEARINYEKCLQLVYESEWVKNTTFVRYFNILKDTYSSLATFDLSGGTDNISFESYMNRKLDLYL